MESKRILITYATYGSGHKTVANYIYEYFKKHSNYEVKMIDLMDYENIIGLISKKAFEKNFKHKTGSLIFSFFYKLFDSKATTMPYKSITKSIFNNKKLKSDIIDYNPNLLISTHFFGNIMLGILNQKGLTHTKIISIITDYKSHEMWLKDEKHIDALIVSNDIVKNELINHGINKKKIYSYGIPIAEDFSYIENKEKTKEKYHVNNNKYTFLFFAGGSAGYATTYRYLKKILEKQYDINILYVCGQNTTLKNRVENLIRKNRYQSVYPLGYSTEVNNLLNISDIVITKPGGLSITEILEMKKPMILIPGTGGQETYNAKFLCKNGYGIKCNSSRQLTKIVEKILYKRSILKNLQRNLDKYSCNSSIKKIYNLSKKMLR